MEATATVSSTESSAGTQARSPTWSRAPRPNTRSSTAVRFKRDGAWHDVSYAELATIVQEVGLGLIDLGIESGRARLHPREHAARVVLRRPRRDLRGRGRRADLPDQLARGVPVGDLRLRRQRDRLRGRRAAREDRRDPRPAARSAHRDRDRRGGRLLAGRLRGARAARYRRSRSMRSASAGARAAAEELDARRAAVRPEDPYTFIYTSGTTGPTEGLRPHARQLQGDHGDGPRDRADPRRRGHLPVPPARALLRAADPADRHSTRAARSPTSAATPSRSSAS